MYKKLILSGAIALAASHATAATWDTDGALKIIHGDLKLGGTSELTGVVQSNAVVRLGAEYGAGDFITFTWDVAKATNASYPSTLASYNTGNAAIDTACQAETGTTVNNASTMILASNGCDAKLSPGDEVTAAGAIPTGGAAGDPMRVIGFVDGTNTATFSTAYTTASAGAGKVFSVLTPKAMSLNLHASGPKYATYRVAAFTGTYTSTVGSLIQVPNPNISASGLVAATNNTVAFSASSAGTAIDALATKVTTASALGEMTYAHLRAFQGVVDVENAKKTFVTAVAANGATAAKTTAKFEYKMSQASGVNGLVISKTASTANTHVDAGITKAVLTINGDFTFLDSNASTAGIQLTSAAKLLHTANDTGGQNGCTNSLATASKLIVTCSTVADAMHGTKNAVSLISDVTGKTIIPQVFTGDMTVTYTNGAGLATATSVVSTGKVFGAFTLNGATITTYAVPMGSSVSRFLWISNKGSDAAVATYTAIMNGSSYGPYALTTVAGNSSVSVAGLIDTDLSARGIYVAPSSRATITVDAPVKAADLTMSAAYKHIGDADRLILETSDSLDGVK